MLIAWKKYKLKKTWEYQEIIKKRNRVFNDQFTIFFRKRIEVKPSGMSNCQFGISIPQKIVKKAFLRNRYRRQVREMIISFSKKNKKFLINFSNWDFVIITREVFKNRKFIENEDALFRLLRFISWKVYKAKLKESVIKKDNRGCD